MPQNSRPRQTVARPMRPSPVLSLNMCIADYLADCRARNLSESTIAHYARAMQLLAECMPSGDVWHSTHGVRTAVATLRERPQYGKSSLSMYLRAWRSFLGFCHVEEFTSENLGKVIKPPKAEPRRDVILDAEAEQQLLDAVRVDYSGVRYLPALFHMERWGRSDGAFTPQYG
jgi:site-specific recombinase XerC